MKSLKGSETEKNLLKAFAGESQARNRYTYFAGAARKEGLQQMALIFEETANQEKEHAKRFFSFLEGGELEITAGFPAGKVGTTLENLQAAAGGENFEWTKLYPAFAKTARDEGYPEVELAFEKILIAERQHEKRYKDLAKNLADGKVFKKDGKVTWRCLNCGYLHESEEAPNQCPACFHPKSYFELLGENSDAGRATVMDDRLRDAFHQSFTGESKAALRLKVFAERAEQDGYPQMAKLFRVISRSEEIHGARALRQLREIKGTEDNLKESFESETRIAAVAYNDFIKLAGELGDTAAALVLSQDRDVEEVHAKLYKEAMAHLMEERETTYYVCKVCGYVSDGVLPDSCPVCQAKAEQFEKIE